MSKWLSSTNAKEIGTLYLVFAVFAGIQKITIMLALYLAVCWETLHKLNIKPVLELGKILYLKGLSAVNFLLRDFTQDNLSFVGDYNTRACAHTIIILILTLRTLALTQILYLLILILY